MRVWITLTSYSFADTAMGEQDFVKWASFVSENIDQLFPGHDFIVDQYPYGKGPAEDTIKAEDESLCKEIQESLSYHLWEEFCVAEDHPCPTCLALLSRALGAAGEGETAKGE